MEIFSHLLNWIQDTGVFIIVLSILIVVHEWGHFITAKKLGVRVEEFALGFGHTLYSKMHNGTLYMLKLLPLGGYVRMAGDERARCQGKSDEFFSKPVGHRALVVLNGPVVNFVLAYVSFVLVFLIGYPGFSTRIVSLDQHGPAWQAGLQIGDKVTSLNGRVIYGWNHLELMLEGNKNEPVQITVLRGDDKKSFNIVPNIVNQMNFLGQKVDMRDLGINAAYTTNIVGEVLKGEPADQAGILKGDQIIGINGVSIDDWKAINENISQARTDMIEVKLLRNNVAIIKNIQPKVFKIKNRQGKHEDRKKIGIAPLMETEKFRFNLFDSIVNAYDKLWEVTVMTYKSVYYMITGSLSAKESVGGPVLIFNVVKSAAHEGIADLLLVLGVVSASLAIFNLFPVIPLDGGHLLLLGIEKVRGRPLPEKVEDYINRIGLVLIIMLALFIFYIDFERIGLIGQIQKLFSIFGK